MATDARALLSRLEDAATGLTAGQPLDPEAVALVMIDAVSELLPGLGQRKLGFALLIPQDLTLLVNQAFALLYTIESEQVITAVVSLWDRVIAWLLGVPSITEDRPHTTGLLENQLQHLTVHKNLVGPLVVWYSSFTRITGANTLPSSCSSGCMALLVHLIAMAGPQDDSVRQPNQAIQALDQDIHVRAAASLIEVMKQGPISELLALERQYLNKQAPQQVLHPGNTSSPASMPSKPPPLLHLGATNTAHTPGSTATTHTCDICRQLPFMCMGQQAPQPSSISVDAESSAEHVQYALQCYQLIVWLLQRPCLDEHDWNNAIHGKLAYELTAECFAAFNGTPQLLQKCLTSTLAGLVQILMAKAPGTRKRGTGKKPSTVASSTTAAGKFVIQLPDDVGGDGDNGSTVQEVGKGISGSQAAAGVLSELLEGRVQPCKHLRDWVWGCAAERVMDVVGRAPGISAMVTALMMAGANDKDMGVAMLGILQLMYGSDAQSHIQVLVDLVRPEANCAVDVRVRAITAMYSSASKAIPEDDEMEDGNQTPGTVAAGLWSSYAVDVVLFCVMHDPSPKVRRAAIKLMSVMGVSVGVDHSIDCKAVHVLLAKVHDRDIQVARQALNLLIRLPPSLVVKHHTSYSSSSSSSCHHRTGLLFALIKFTTPEGGADIMALATKTTAHAIRKKTCALIKALLLSASSGSGSTLDSTLDHPLSLLLSVGCIDPNGHSVVRDALVTLCVEGVGAETHTDVVGHQGMGEVQMASCPMG